ncbi:hypothetical protein NYE48_23125 [Paenibacillus sp. FSL M7-1455]|uniref:hypothetical protein n=1 Tax=Paenibacillus sp. FSL M7-1455 TaxID=2975316 RepID=UPI0030F80DAB
MREKNIEQKLVLMTKDLGGLALKLVSPGFDGMPDRLILLPERKIAFWTSVNRLDSQNRENYAI